MYSGTYLLNISWRRKNTDELMDNGLCIMHYVITFKQGVNVQDIHTGMIKMTTASQNALAYFFYTP